MPGTTFADIVPAGPLAIFNIPAEVEKKRIARLVDRLSTRNLSHRRKVAYRKGRTAQRIAYHWHGRVYIGSCRRIVVVDTLP